MFSGIKRLLGNVTVVVRGGEVFVEGVPGDTISRDIRKIWKTSKVEAGLFSHIGDSSFSFNEFFCIEILYAIDTLLAGEKTTTSIRTLTKIRSELVSKTWLGQTTQQTDSRLDYSLLKDFKFSPLEHQSRFFTYYDQITGSYGLNGMMLAASAGGGKTICSLMLMRMLGVDHVIVVSPTNALYKVWNDTLQSAYEEPVDFWICKDAKAFTGKEYCSVINYEYLGKFLNEVKKLKGKRVGVILDESHNFNTHDSLRTETFVELCKLVDCQDVLWLSGTPIKALATEAIPLLRTIDPLFTADCETRFKKIFGVSSDRAMDIMKNRLGIVSFKVEKKELNVTPPIFKDIKVSIPNGEEYTLESITKKMKAYTEERVAYFKSREKEDKELYQKCLNVYQRQIRDRKEFEQFEDYRAAVGVIVRCNGDARFCKEEMIYANRFEAKNILPSLPKELRDQFKEVKTIIKYVKLKIQGECLGRVVGRARIDAHIDMCRQIDYVALLETTVKKTVVFTSFVEVVEVLKKYLPDLGLEAMFVYAKTNANLASIIDAFEKDENKNPLVATYASLSTAVPLLMADSCILLNSVFRDYQLQQAVSRINRIGATTQCFVYNVSLDTGTKTNISTRSFDILKWSQTAVEAVTGIKSPFELSDDLEQTNFALEDFENTFEDTYLMDDFKTSLNEVQSVFALESKPTYLDWK